MVTAQIEYILPYISARRIHQAQEHWNLPFIFFFKIFVQPKNGRIFFIFIFAVDQQTQIAVHHHCAVAMPRSILSGGRITVVDEDTQNKTKQNN